MAHNYLVYVKENLNCDIFLVSTDVIADQGVKIKGPFQPTLHALGSHRSSLQRFSSISIRITFWFIAKILSEFYYILRSGVPFLFRKVYFQSLSIVAIILCEACLLLYLPVRINWI